MPLQGNDTFAYSKTLWSSVLHTACLHTSSPEHQNLSQILLPCGFTGITVRHLKRVNHSTHPHDPRVMLLESFPLLSYLHGNESSNEDVKKGQFGATFAVETAQEKPP